MVRFGRVTRLCPAGEGRKEYVRVDGLGDVIVHPGVEAALALFDECVGSHSDDWQVSEA